jgi:hypothetical protein
MWVPETRSGCVVNLAGLGSGSLVGDGRVEGGVFATGWPVSGGSGRLTVFVDESATGPVSSDRLSGQIRRDAVVSGRALAE